MFQKFSFTFADEIRYKSKHNNMTKRFITLCMAAILSLGAWADEYPYLVFENSDGSTKVVSVENLKIVFSDGNLVATSDKGGASIPLSTLAKMYFSATSTLEGINSIDMRMAEEGYVYNLQGVRVAKAPKEGNRLYDLPNGVYIIYRNGKTEKTVVK